MILGTEKLLELVKEKNLVEGLCDREINNPEGTVFDLRLGEVYEIEGDGYLGIEERHTPETKIIAKFDEKKQSSFTFESGKYYLIKTIEKVNLPNNIAANIFPRTTLFRSGLALLNGIVNPGYCGELTFGLYNVGGQEIKIDMGARVVQIAFHEILGEGVEYRGQWQGGRVSTDGKKETQV